MTCSIPEFIARNKKENEQKNFLDVIKIKDIKNVTYVFVGYMCSNIYMVNCSANNLDTAIASVDNLIDIVRNGLIALGIGLISICTIKNIISHIESSDRQKAIACLVDAGIITATLFLVDIVIKAVSSAFGG